MSKLEKSLEETQVKSGSQIQRLELLLLFEANKTKEAYLYYLHFIVFILVNF